MKRSTRWLARGAVGSALLLLIVAGFILFQYTTAVSLGEVYPQEQATLSDGRITILAGIPGLDPEKGDVSVWLNGEPVSPADLEPVPAGGVTISRELADGEHQVRVDVRTRNLFARHLSHSWSFEVDTQPPLITGLSPAAEATLAQNQTAFQAYFDEAVQSDLSVDGKEVLRGETTRLQGTLDLGEGVHELIMRARDDAGNLAAKRWSVLVDTTAPTFSLDRAPEGTWTEGRSHLELLVKDALARSVEVNVLADGKALGVSGGEAVRNADSSGETAWSYEIDTSGLGEGEHSFALGLRDDAGNSTEWQSTFSIDVRKIRVDLSERRLYHYAAGVSVKEYPVAVGLPEYPTPRGTYEIIVKEKDPTWNPPPSPWAEGLEPVPPGPGNPLGTRWIGISAYAIGIHGTYERDSIGRAASHGCIRMLIEDVEELFEQVEVGLPVEIVR